MADGETRTVKIDARSDAEVFDALTGKKLGEHGKATIEMKRGGSKLLRLGNGNSDIKK